MTIPFRDRDIHHINDEWEMIRCIQVFKGQSATLVKHIGGLFISKYVINYRSCITTSIGVAQTNGSTAKRDGIQVASTNHVVYYHSLNICIPTSPTPTQTPQMSITPSVITVPTKDDSLITLSSSNMCCR